MSNKLYHIISNVMQVPVSEIDDNSGPETIEKWNSFQTLVLLDHLETTFDLKFTLDEVIGINKVADIKRILNDRGVSLDK